MGSGSDWRTVYYEVRYLARGSTCVTVETFTSLDAALARLLERAAGDE